MDESDRLSLLALVVAVIALIISSWQLAQQLFATATDGKRFCQGSVMGIWARKTRLSWRWSQIRFETKYTTPEITLSSLADQELLRNGPTVPLHPGATRKRRLMYRIPVVKTITEIFNGPASDFEGFFDICAADGDEPWELRQTRIPDLSIKPKLFKEKLAKFVIRLWHTSFEQDSPDLVTWPAMLQSIYENQLKATAVSSFPPSMNAREHWCEKGGSAEPLRHSVSKAGTEDRVVIRLIERSWDLVPPDVVRLGMHWHDFDPNEGRMRGSGYGHEMSSETIRGLGLVLQYQYTYRQESRRIKEPTTLKDLLDDGQHFAPTQSADKLHCGIIPTDRKATRLPRRAILSDIQLVDSTGQIDLENFYNVLGIRRKTSEQIDENINGAGSRTQQHAIDQNHVKHEVGASRSPGRHFRFAVEDAIAMLCPIVPKLSSDARFIMWPLRNRFQPFTPLRQYPGVTELKDQLEASLKTNKRLSDIMEDRKATVLEPMDRSPLQYLQDICDAIVDNQHPSQKSRLNAQNTYLPTSDSRLSTAVQIHSETSAVFKLVEERVGMPDNDEEYAESVRPFLLDLVAAHVTMAAKHGATADDAALQCTIDEDDSFSARRMRFVKKLASLYAEDIESGPGRAVAKHLRHRGYTKDQLKPIEITALWWVLVLRGICWWTTVQVKLPDSQIPSYWYYSQTPVYIT